MKTSICGRASVSYTHLRAHETVLDLVCRLLLEKKKTLTFSDHIISYTPLLQPPSISHYLVLFYYLNKNCVELK
ncbi:hypothetical protein PVA38_11555 [Streptococcus pneumoniae D39]|nr:hypothetical protein PVA38_11555 [Streptococcus pneumoniae D39]